MSVNPVPNQESTLAVVQPTALPTAHRGPRLGLPTPDELAVLKQYGEILFKSGMVPTHIKSPEAAIVAIRYAHQLGVDEITGMQNMFVLNGKPAAMAGLLHSLILRDHGGRAIKVIESSAERCVLECRRSDSNEVVQVSYTADEAEAAGLLKKDGPWKQYPADMLFARCISRAGRQVFRDSTMGMYTPEEIGGSFVEVKGEIIDVASGETPRDERPANSNRLARLHAIGDQRGLDHDALHRVAMLKLGTSLGDAKLTDTMLRDFESLIETSSDQDLVLWQLDWNDEIRSAEARGLDALLELGTSIKNAGITSKSHPGIAAAWADAKKRVESQPIEATFSSLPGMPAEDRYTS